MNGVDKDNPILHSGSKVYFPHDGYIYMHSKLTNLK